MRGLYTKFLWNWPIKIEHNSKQDPDKLKRYDIGFRRLAFLKKNAEFFGYKATEDGQIVAYLVQLDPEDLSPEMPSNVKYEYLAGSEIDGRIKLFAYLWFKNLNEAKKYASWHELKLIGGWHEKKAN